MKGERQKRAGKPPQRGHLTHIGVSHAVETMINCTIHAIMYHNGFLLGCQYQSNRNERAVAGTIDGAAKLECL